MSTSSTVIVVVEMDLTLGNDIDIGNQICILVATQGDGTLLGPSSLKEQHIVELCIRIDQKHPKGVLQLLETESVLAFWCNTNMMATKCYLTVVKVWRGDLIVLCILPPKGRQGMKYITKRSSHPSSLACPAQAKGHWKPQLPHHTTGTSMMINHRKC